MAKWLKKLKSFICLLIFISLALSSLQPALANPLEEQDEFDRLRMKWRYYLTGEDRYELPVTDPDLAARIDGITSNGQSAWSTMNKEADRTYLWVDAVPSRFPDSSYIYENIKRLYRMALAYTTKGSSLEGNPELLNDTIQGLDWVYENQYNERLDWKVNYHHWEINIPTTLSNISTLLYDRLGEARISNYMNAVHKFANDPTTYALSTVPSYGANRLSESLPIALRGILVKDRSRLALVRDRLGDFEALIYPFVMDGNGWYRDGSFISHDRHAYNGTYGLEQYSILISLMYLLDGSSWEITDPRVDNVYQWTNDGYLPLVHRGRMMDMVNGRSIARPGSSDHVQGNKLIDSLLILSEFADPQNALLYKQVIKEWVQGKTGTGYDYRKGASIPMLLRANAILKDDTVTAAPPLSYTQYSGMDRAVQQRPTYAFGVSMFSNRVYDFETVNGENLKGWYTSSGMTYVYDRDISQYNENYWTTVNMKRLPGTTVDAEYGRPEADSNKLSTKSWVGGVEISDLFGASGMELEGYRTTLNAKKSWFAFDDEIVALGSDIDSTDDRTIETIIENRRLKAEGEHRLTVNGEVLPTSDGWSAELGGVRDIHLEGRTEGSDIGYVFPDGGATVQALQEVRSGTWSDVSRLATDPKVYSNRFLNLWFDHGKSPANAKYSYILLPDRTAEEVSRYSAQPDVTILEQNEYVHAVRENDLNVTAALFWSDVKRTVDRLITADKKAAVAVRETDGRLEVAVSDPTHENRGIIEVEIHRSAAGVVESDASIKVLRLEPTIRLAVQTNGSLGRTQSILFDLVNEEKPSALILSPVADASVHGGDAATETFGASTTMSARDAGDASKNRKSYVKFDLASVETVDRAVLRVNTFHPSGAFAVLNAYGAGNGWTEQDIRWDNAPAAETGALDWTFVNGMERYYELDVTEYVRGKAADVGTATLMVAGTDYEDVNLALHSREHSYRGPQLAIEGTFASGTPVAVPDSPSYGNATTVAADESFDGDATGSMPEGWSVRPIGGQAAVYEQPGSMNDRELLLTSDAEGLTASFPFEPQQGLVFAEFRVKAQSSAVPFEIALLESAGEEAAVKIALNGKGRITATDGGSVSYLQSYAANVWYKIKLVLDTQTDAYDIYIDEARKGARLELTRPSEALSAIRFAAAPTGRFYVDDATAGIADAMEPAPTERDILNRDAADAVLPQYTVNDHFNVSGTDSLVGWAFNQAGGTVRLTDQPNGVNKSLSIVKSGTGQTAATKSFGALGGKTAVEFWLRPEQTDQTFGAPYVRDAGNRDIAIVLFGNNGNITAFHGSSGVSIMPYQAGEWYHMRLEIDPIGKMYDLYINGKLAADNYAYRNASASGVSRLLFFSNATSGALQIDNVRVVSEEDEMASPAPGTTPSITLQAPEEARPKEAVQVRLDLQSMGYEVRPERIVVAYDEGVLSFEGLEGGAPEASYVVAAENPGRLALTWTESVPIADSADLPRLNFRVKDQPDAERARIELFTAEMFLLPDGVSVRTPREEAVISIHADVTSFYTVNDDFNGSELPTSWLYNEAGGTVRLSDMPNGANRSLSIVNARSGQTAAIREFDSLTGEVTVEYWVKPAQRNQTFGAPYAKDAAGRDNAVILFLNNGTIQAFNGSAPSATVLMSYQADEWYHMRLVLDTDSKTYDLFINGMPAADDFAFRNASSAGIGRLQFFSNATAGALHLDNVRVISEADLSAGPNPAEVPALTLQAPEEAPIGEAFHVQLNMENRGYEVRPERAILAYDPGVFTYEGLDETVSSSVYDINDSTPGYIAFTWLDAAAFAANEPLTRLNFKVNEGAAAEAGSIRLFASELYLLAEGASIRTGHDDATVNVLRDTTAPVSSATLSPESPNGGDGWYTVPMSVRLEAVDDLSGPDRIEIRLNGGVTWDVYRADSVHLLFAQDGEYTLAYRAADKAGNVEEERSIAWKLDRTAPEIDFGIIPNAVYSNTGELTLQVSVTDQGSGADAGQTVIMLDGLPAEPDAAIPLYRLPPGAHTLTVSASDRAGNTSSGAVTFYTETSLQALKELVERFAETGAIENRGIAVSLLQKLEAESLQSFVNEANALRGKHIATEEAEILIRNGIYLLNQ
ncbi:polysaccharide lyase family 8 super-sandwich domain-containing protein [Paenibacillus antri]|uniref:polysaccharide lyase family 8 super-sandwich domain-containing protein n=1 Tax=Paenibacillus antri TaxID=2582848 RepID=UPI0013052072|nr:polysaccharide lyase family 8 super-sandwich domain-containing protein [Paenibacillus antri]